MEELIISIEKFINIYESNQIPNWLTIICSIVLPLVLSIIVIFQNCKHNKQNEKLQKDILNNEIKMKIYDIILNVYITFYNSLSVLPLSQEGLDRILNGLSKTNQILIEIVEEKDKVILVTNQVKLLLKNDNELVGKIIELKELYIVIVDKLLDSIIEKNNLNCDEIYKLIQKYKLLLEYDNYDKYFEKYLSFKEI